MTPFDFASARPLWALAYLVVLALALAAGLAAGVPALARASLLHVRAARQREARLTRRVEALHTTLRALRVDMNQRLTVPDGERMVASHNAAMQDVLALRNEFARHREEVAPFLKQLSQHQAASIFEE